MLSSEEFSTEVIHRNHLQDLFIRRFVGDETIINQMDFDDQLELFRLISSIIDSNEKIRTLAEAEEYEEALELMKHDWDNISQELAA